MFLFFLKSYLKCLPFCTFNAILSNSVGNKNYTFRFPWNFFPLLRVFNAFAIDVNKFQYQICIIAKQMAWNLNLKYKSENDFYCYGIVDQLKYSDWTFYAKVEHVHHNKKDSKLVSRAIVISDDSNERHIQVFYLFWLKSSNFINRHFYPLQKVRISLKSNINHDIFN